MLVKPTLVGVDMASTTTGYQEISLITSMTANAPTPPVAHDSSVTHTSTPTVPVSQIHGPRAPSTPDTPSVITSVSMSASPAPSHLVFMSLVTPSPHPPGTTTSTQMDLGPNTLLAS